VLKSKKFFMILVFGVFMGACTSFCNNTDMKKELDHLGMFLAKARDYGRKIGFKGTYMIEPKPMEPTKHQYDFLRLLAKQLILTELPFEE